MKILAIFALLSFAPLAKSANCRQLLSPHTPAWAATRPHRAVGKEYMITTQGPRSSEVGRQIFRQGGNAVDVAVAVSFALGVERPQSTGLGGGGFMLLHLAKEGKTLAVDFREVAPQSSEAADYLDKRGRPIAGASARGPGSRAVPGMVAGLWEIHRRHGKLPWASLIEPAIGLAEEGLKVYPELALAIKAKARTLRRNPKAREIFFLPDGRPLPLGGKLRQPDLARTLRIIQTNGRDGLYKGEIARQLASSDDKVSLADLESYRVVFREPLWGTFKGHKIASMPPPSSGGINLLQILNILEPLPLAKHGAHSLASVHWIASAMQLAYASRSAYLGDADFVRVPARELAGKEYAAKLRAKIPPAGATPSNKVAPPPPKESDETTHFNVMDAEGNTIASTQTVNGPFGAGEILGKTGFFLNNEMNDFAIVPGDVNDYQSLGGAPNVIEGGKRPLSSMAPTIVFDRQDRPLLALGTPAGTRITSCVAQTLLYHLLYGMPLEQAVLGLRYHHQWFPNQVRVEKPGFGKRLTQQLSRQGYRIKIKSLGCKVNAIIRKGGRLTGFIDPRGEGKSVGK